MGIYREPAAKRGIGRQGAARKPVNHKGHPFDSPFASSGSLRAGCGTQRGKSGRELSRGDRLAAGGRADSSVRKPKPYHG